MGIFEDLLWGLFLESPETFRAYFSRLETLQLFLFLFPLQHVKRPVLQNKQVVALRMAFRTRKVFGTFEKQAPGNETITPPIDLIYIWYCRGSFPGFSWLFAVFRASASKEKFPML